MFNIDGTGLPLGNIGQYIPNIINV